MGQVLHGLPSREPVQTENPAQLSLGELALHLGLNRQELVAQRQRGIIMRVRRQPQLLLGLPGPLNPRSRSLSQDPLGTRRSSSNRSIIASTETK